MSTGKPSTAEETYFLQEELAQRKREALQKAKDMEQAEREHLRQLHYMKCPKCGFDLYTVSLHGVEIDKCSHCGGIWLDDQELDRLVTHREPGIFEKVARFFQQKQEPFKSQ